MLTIRFFRVGKRNQPFFKIVVTDKRRPPRAGRFVEEVGFYNPKTKEKSLKAERIKHWIASGAKPSDTVYNLLIGEKIVEGKKIPSHKKSKKQVEVKEETKEAKKTEEKVEEKPVEPAPVKASVAEPTPEKPEPSEEKPAEGAPVEEARKEETE